MTPYERLMAEEIPVRPTPAEPDPGGTWTPEEQAQHRADLDEAIRDWSYRPGRSHLRLVDTQPDGQAA